jgi:hypothetical protein
MSIIQLIGSGGLVPAPDADATSLVAALPLNQQFSFTDQSTLIRGSGNSATVVNYANVGGEITIQNSQSKFYGSSARKPLSSPAGTTFVESYVSINTGSGTQFGTGDFCIEAWMWTGDFDFASQAVHGFCFPRWRNNNADLFGYVPNIRIKGSNWVSGGGTRGLIFFNPEETVTICQTGTVLSPNTWHHIAITRSGSTNRIFVDGVLQAIGTSSLNYPGYEYWMFANIRVLGAAFHFQDVRIYKGAAKYTSTFTPPGSLFI